MSDLNNNLTDEQREAIQRTQAEHYFALAREAQAHLDGATQNTWLDRLETEHGNLLAALDYYTNQPDTAREELELALYCTRLWEMHGHYQEAIARLYHALARQASGEDQPKALALARLSQIAYRQGNYQQAQQWLDESITTARKLPDAQRNECLAFALNVEGRVHKDQGDNEKAKRAFEEALVFASQSQIKKRMGWALRGLGQVAEATGDIGAAKQYHTQSLRIQEEIENLREIAAQRDSLGLIAQAEGDITTARQYFEQSLALRQGGGNRNGMAECHLNLGRLEQATGNVVEAQLHFERSRALAVEIGSKKLEKRATEALRKLTLS